eukprot:g23351.t1
MPQPCDPDGCAGKKDQDARSCTDKPQFTDPTDTETARKCCLHYSQHPDQVIIGGLCNSSVKEPTGEIGCVYQYEALTSKDFLPLDDLNGINSMPCGADGKRPCSGWKDWRDHCYDPEGRRSMACPFGLASALFLVTSCGLKLAYPDPQSQPMCPFGVLKEKFTFGAPPSSDPLNLCCLYGLGSCEVNGTDGSDAELTARGFMQVMRLMDNKEMVKFASRYVSERGGAIKNEGGFDAEIYSTWHYQPPSNPEQAWDGFEEQINKSSAVDWHPSPAPAPVKGGSSAVWWVLIILVVLAALGFAGYKYYSRSQQQARQQLLPSDNRQVQMTTALKALARVHLSRVKEPDAPVAAINEATKALEVFNKLDQEILDARLHADILFVLGDAQLTKALASPFSEAREESLEAAAATMRQASEVYKKLGETKWLGRSMLGTALALVGLEDEDQQMDGERLAEDAKDHRNAAASAAGNVVAVMLIVKCRIRTSGLDCALLSAEDAAEDWKEETGRPEHVAIALHTAASVYFQLKDAGSDRNRQIATKSYLWCWITGFSFLLFLIKTISDRKGLTGQPNIVLRLSSFSVLLSGAEPRQQCFKPFAEWTLAYQAEAALSKLNTEANTLPTEEAQALADEGKQCSDKARDIFLELGDKEGLQIVDEVTFVSTNVAVEKYCEISDKGFGEQDEHLLVMDCEGGNNAMAAIRTLVNVFGLLLGSQVVFVANGMATEQALQTLGMSLAARSLVRLEEGTQLPTQDSVLVSTWET